MYCICIFGQPATLNCNRASLLIFLHQVVYVQRQLPQTLQFFKLILDNQSHRLIFYVCHTQNVSE